MYIDIIAFITLHVLNNYLPKDGHQCCQWVHYIQNWSCVQDYKKSYFCRMSMGYHTLKTTIPHQTPSPLHFMTSFQFKKHSNIVLPHRHKILWCGYCSEETYHLHLQTASQRHKQYIPLEHCFPDHM